MFIYSAATKQQIYKNKNKIYIHVTAEQVFSTDCWFSRKEISRFKILALKLCNHMKPYYPVSFALKFLLKVHAFAENYKS